MTISKLLVAALLLTSVGAAAAPAVPAVPAAPAAPAAPAIKLSGITGVVQIKTAGGVMTVKAGEPIPDIASGAEIIVVSGDANVAVDGVTVKAGAGDSFTVNTAGAGAVSIAVTGGVVAVVDAKGVSKDLAKGEGTTVATAAATPATPAAPVAKTEEKKAETPESIPADTSDTTSDSTTTSPPAASVTQESGTTASTTVSPSAP